MILIHRAQIRSLQLSHTKNAISEEDILKISLEKGGTSVLADGYLVSGRLSVSQARFLLGYGVYLQMLDDLQDVQEDHDKAIQTVFSRMLPHTPLDRLACRTWHFGSEVMKPESGSNFGQAELMLDLINRSMTTMIIEAVGTCRRFYSTAFSRRMERHSPFHFSFLNDKRRSSSPVRLMSITEFSGN